MTNRKQQGELHSLKKPESLASSDVVSIKDYWLGEEANEDDLEHDILLLEGDVLNDRIEREWGEGAADKARQAAQNILSNSVGASVDKTEGKTPLKRIIPVAACVAAAVVLVAFFGLFGEEKLYQSNPAVEIASPTNDVQETPTALASDPIDFRISLAGGSERIIRDFSSAKIEKFVDSNNWFIRLRGQGVEYLAFSVQVSDEYPSFLGSVGAVGISNREGDVLGGALSEVHGFNPGLVHVGEVIRGIVRMGESGVFLEAAMLPGDNSQCVQCVSPEVQNVSDSGLFVGAPVASPTSFSLTSVAFSNGE